MWISPLDRFSVHKIATSCGPDLHWLHKSIKHKTAVIGAAVILLLFKFFHEKTIMEVSKCSVLISKVSHTSISSTNNSKKELNVAKA